MPVPEKIIFPQLANLTLESNTPIRRSLFSTFDPAILSKNLNSIFFIGGDFLMKHFKDASTGKVNFSTTREGKPSKMQRTIFSEVFYCMAMVGLSKATQEIKYQVTE